MGFRAVKVAWGRAVYTAAVSPNEPEVMRRDLSVSGGGGWSFWHFGCRCHCCLPPGSKNIREIKRGGGLTCHMRSSVSSPFSFLCTVRVMLEMSSAQSCAQSAIDACVLVWCLLVRVASFGPFHTLSPVQRMNPGRGVCRGCLASSVCGSVFCRVRRPWRTRTSHRVPLGEGGRWEVVVARGVTDRWWGRGGRLCCKVRGAPDRLMLSRCRCRFVTGDRQPPPP